MRTGFALLLMDNAVKTSAEIVVAAWGRLEASMKENDAVRQSFERAFGDICFEASVRFANEQPA